MTVETILLKSSAFNDMQPIPRKYTCDGNDFSPPLEWSHVSGAAKSLVIICDDPDAPRGDWVHWVLYDLPVSTNNLKERIPQEDTLEGGGTQGINDFRKIGYNGPCPPCGTHRYSFKIYALDLMLQFPAGKTKRDIEKAMDKHILARGELIGTYSRK